MPPDLTQSATVLKFWLANEKRRMPKTWEGAVFSLVTRNYIQWLPTDRKILRVLNIYNLWQKTEHGPRRITQFFLGWKIANSTLKLLLKLKVILFYFLALHFPKKGEVFSSVCVCSYYRKYNHLYNKMYWEVIAWDFSA